LSVEKRGEPKVQVPGVTFQEAYERSGLVAEGGLANPRFVLHNPQAMKTLLLAWEFSPPEWLTDWTFELAGRVPEQRATRPRLPQKYGPSMGMGWARL